MLLGAVRAAFGPWGRRGAGQMRKWVRSLKPLDRCRFQRRGRRPSARAGKDASGPSVGRRKT